MPNEMYNVVIFVKSKKIKHLEYHMFFINLGFVHVMKQATIQGLKLKVDLRQFFQIIINDKTPIRIGRHYNLNYLKAYERRTHACITVAYGPSLYYMSKVLIFI